MPDLIVSADVDAMMASANNAAIRTAIGAASTSGKLSQFAATTSAELAGVISDETGTGALVFASSPTLVTPALGTPASGNLENCTGYPFDSLADIPLTFPPAAHDHPYTQITGLGTLATQDGTFSGTSSGTNTGDQTITLTGDVTGSGTGSFVATIANGAVDIAMLSATGTPSGSTFLRGDNTWATPAGSGDVSKVGTPVNNQVGVWTGDGTIEGAANFTYDGSNLQVTGDIGSTGTRITKGWFTDLQVTNAIAGSVTGNAATVTTNANLTGHVTSTGNAAVLGSFTKAQLNTAVSDGDVVYSGDALGTPSSGTLTNCTGYAAVNVTGLGTIATQAANNVSITGGSISGITDLAITDGGTGQSNAQDAINALTQVSAATNEHVLTKDTATGNATWKAAPSGGGGGGEINLVFISMLI
jgi:hypothetical protein